ncbi:oxygenase MpaB family protein [Acidisoma cladoniae]|uniref:oxygenase MpaB family protein n=1 Tax=Acidisoma cladoniae TaxID=3040935 RepID=UPI00254DE83D|nr:oxygenase MpaB family protein [Acidisoma sp. PAMC 29798]
MPQSPPSSSMMPRGGITQPIKHLIASQTVAMFNDRARGERPVVRQPDGLFGPSAVAWRVHGDVASMMVGGIASLLLQMLHPAVLAGVWDHSNFRTDMHGRLRRTARFIALTTYGGRVEAEAMLARIRKIHDQVRGVLPNGTAYAANDPALLAWVHVTETSSFLDAWIRYAEPRMRMIDQDRYFAEMVRIGEPLGAFPVPRSRREARALLSEMRPQLLCDARTREVAKLVLNQPAQNWMTEPLQALTMQAGIDLLPPWARQQHGLHNPGLGRPLIRGGTLGIARTLRWAFS